MSLLAAIPSFIQQSMQSIEAFFAGKPPSVPVQNAIVATQKAPATPPAAVADCPLKNGGCGSGMNIDDAVSHLENSYVPMPGNGMCAKYVRQAIEAGGVKLDPSTRPVSAKDYGPYLEANGFKEVSTDNYVPQAGDVAVIQGYPAGPIDPNTGEPTYKAADDGHIAMYTGDKWGSDFEQTDMWGGPHYRQIKPDYKIYRP